MMRLEAIQKRPIAGRKWSHYIQGAMALIHHYPRIRDIAWQQVQRRTANFLEVHDLETYIAQNKREWIDMHTLLAGRPMKAEDCLPYVFERLAAN